MGCLQALPYAGSAHAEVQIVFAGSGSNLAITRTLAMAFVGQYPAIHIDIPPSIGSSGGISAVADGSIDVGLISRPLKDEERQLDLTVQPYARTAVIFGVNPTVEEKGITSAELLAILKGQQSRWPNRQEIVVLVREPGDSAIRVLEKRLPGFKTLYDDAWRTRRWMALFTDQKMNRMLARTPHAIGITDMGSITAGQWGIKALEFDGIHPSVENIVNRKYPLTKDLAFAYKAHDLSPAAGKFMDYVRSASGRDILQHNGYVPAD